MHQPPARASSDLPDADSVHGTGPVLVLDPAAGTVLEANAAGWQALGLDAHSIAPPIALDCAMPAVQRLREMTAGTSDGPTPPQTLTFWTPLGCVSYLCEMSRAADRGALFVRILDTVAGLQPVGGAQDQTTPEPAADAMPDVALRAKLAHELRSPLAAVAAYAEILKDEHFGPLGSDRYQGYARNIYESSRHAMSVVESMLCGDAETPGAPELTFADIDPAGIVRSCLAVAEPLAERAGLILTADVPPHLPRIVADAVSLRQMLLNLLANAIKFARRGDRVNLTVSYDCNGPLRIAVVDTGPGMEATSLNVRRKPRSRLADTGLGLGLPLTRSLAEANGAVLAIDSALGRGTCATITFGKDRLVPV